jgi:hypothetical protein
MQAQHGIKSLNYYIMIYLVIFAGLAVVAVMAETLLIK